MVRPQSSRLPARDRILTAAAKLFYREGVQNVGIDRIIAESGVAKMSLYNHFKSKDALIAAYLQQYDDHWGTWLPQKVEALATAPGDRILAIFDILHHWFEQPDFRGCAFINATVELADPDHPGYRVAVKHKQMSFDYILSLAKAAALPHPADLAQQVQILIEGAIVVAMMQRNPTVALQAKQAATALIAAAKPDHG